MSKRPAVPVRVSNVAYHADSADVIQRIRPFYLDGRRIADLTPGAKLGFWKGVTGLDVTLSPHNYHQLPYTDGQFETVCFDPSFCVSLDTKILSSRGWLSHDEVNTGDLVWTLDHETGRGGWDNVLDVVHTPGDEREVHEWKGLSHSSRSDAEHRWPVVLRKKTHGPQRTFVRSSSVTSEMSVPIGARRFDWPQKPTHSDAWVELVAWFYTEGHIEGTRCGESTESLSPYGCISQSPIVNPDKCARIESCLEAVAERVDYFPRTGRRTDGVERWRVTTDCRPPLNDKNAYWFNTALGKRLLESAPRLLPSFEFLDSLTEQQMELFYKTCLDGDGHVAQNGKTVFVQKNAANALPFELAARMLGHGISASTGKSDLGEWVRMTVRRDANFKPTRQAKCTVERSTEVLWCVRTKNQTWMAQRNGKSYFTGNCPYGGRDSESAEAQAMMSRYGLDTVPGNVPELEADMLSGLAEAVRVCVKGGYVIQKCQQAVVGGNLVDWPYMMKRAVENWPVRLYDEVLQERGLGMQPLTRTLKDGTTIPRTFQRTQRAVSNWLIWQKR
jgi:hypothetical protein